MSEEFEPVQPVKSERSFSIRLEASSERLPYVDADQLAAGNGLLSQSRDKAAYLRAQTALPDSLTSLLEQVQMLLGNVCSFESSRYHHSAPLLPCIPALEARGNELDG